MKTIKFAYVSRNEIAVVYNEYTATACYSQYKDNRFDWNTFNPNQLNKQQATSLLADLKSATIIINSEEFAAEEIQTHNMCIERISKYITATWPDYQALFNAKCVEHNQLQNDYYALANKLSELREDNNKLSTQLSSAGKKIAALKRRK